MDELVVGGKYIPIESDYPGILIWAAKGGRRAVLRPFIERGSRIDSVAPPGFQDTVMSVY